MTRKILTYSFFGTRQDVTGFSSYTRSLAQDLKLLDTELKLLLGRRAHKRHRSGLPQEQAIAIFGNDILDNVPRWARILNLSSWLSNPYRAKTAVPVSTDGVDLLSLDPPLPVHDQVFNVKNLYDSAQKMFFLTRRFTEIVLPEKVDLAHWPAAMPVHIKGIPNVYTVHDLIPVRFPHFVVDHNAYYAKMLSAVTRKADLIVAISERTRDDILRILKVSQDRVQVVYQSLPKLPDIATDDAERLVESVYGLVPGKYAFFAGAIEPKKNLLRLMEGFLLSGVDIPLAVVGRLGWLYESEVAFMKRVAENFDRPREAPIRWLGHLPRRHVVALLKCARFLVFPSLYEGFGLPVLEAMSLGVPVLTSTAGSLPEVSGDAALLVDPLSIEEIARGIRTLSVDADMRGELIERGSKRAAMFSSEGHAEGLRQAYRKVGISFADEVRSPGIRREQAV